jgi:NADH:ubiquinone oxidoreductase subunit E
MSVTVTEKFLFAEVQNIIDAHNNDEHDLLGILLEIQAIVPQQYISKEVTKFISEKLKISNNDVCEVVTFYSALSDKQRGRNIIQICNSTACMVNKYQTLRNILEQQLGIKVGETTLDNKFTLMYTPCFGACDIAPAFRIGEEVYGNLNEEKIKKIIENYGGM